MADAVDHAIGVDFGTSTSLLAKQSRSLPVQVVPIGRSTNWLPSLAGYADSRLLIGEEAERLPVDQIIRSIKRAITENRDEAIVTVGGQPVEFKADEVIVALLREIGVRAEREGSPLHAGAEVRLGCPAMWVGCQRERLLALAEEAGLPIAPSSLVDEPIAAGIAWLTHRYLAYGERPKGRLLVFDMGGGTLDIAVLHVVGGPEPEISVLSALGVGQAGDTLDQVIASDLVQELARTNVDPSRTDRGGVLEALVLLEARRAKTQLSLQDQHRIVFRGLDARLGLPALVYERARLEELFRPQMDDACSLILAALRAAKMTERNPQAPDVLRGIGEEELSRRVDYVLLAGGMSRIPYVERRIGAMFPQAKIYNDAGVAAEEAIVAGLADTSSYSRLNLHRPGFDFVLEYTRDGKQHSEPIYPAYTPFYEPWEVFSRSQLGFDCSGSRFPGPGRGKGVLRVRSTSGEYLSLRYEGQDMDGFELHLGPGMIFKIYPDGRLLIRDATGREMDMRVAGWPVIRGGKEFRRIILNKTKEVDSTPPLPWWATKEYAPPQMLPKPPRWP